MKNYNIEGCFYFKPTVIKGNIQEKHFDEIGTFDYVYYKIKVINTNVNRLIDDP